MRCKPVELFIILVTTFLSAITSLTTLLSGHYKIINNWDQYKCTFCDAETILRSHKISKMTAQIKKEIENKVNILLLGSGSNKMRVTGEQKSLHALRLGDHKDKKMQ